MSDAEMFDLLCANIRNDLGWDNEHIAEYLGACRTTIWHKLKGDRIKKTDLLSLAGLLAMRNRIYIDTFWEIANV